MEVGERRAIVVSSHSKVPWLVHRSFTWPSPELLLLGRTGRPR